MTLLVVFGLTRFSAQITFSNNECDWLANKLVQNKILIIDSVSTHKSLLIKDSTNYVLRRKLNNIELEVFETNYAYENCKTQQNQLFLENLKLTSKTTKLKKVLIPTIIISILKTGIIVFVVKKT